MDWSNIDLINGLRKAKEANSCKYGLRHQSDQGCKGEGFLGTVPDQAGNPMTEYTTGVEMNGKETDIPTLVPTLTREQVQQIRNYQVDEGIQRKALAHALQRMKAGRSVYAEPGEVYDLP